MPSALCGSVCPAAWRDRPGRGSSRVVAAWQLPGTASYSAYVATVGPAPVVYVAQNAVGMPPLPASTSKPASRIVCTYHAADRYSRNAGSAKSQMVFVHADRAAAFRSTQSSAICLASDISHPPSGDGRTACPTSLGADLAA